MSDVATRLRREQTRLPGTGRFWLKTRNGGGSDKVHHEDPAGSMAEAARSSATCDSKPRSGDAISNSQAGSVAVAGRRSRRRLGSRDGEI